MGFGKILGNIGKAVKKGVVDVGHFTGKVASNPIAQGVAAMIPGLGIPAAAIMGGVGNLIKPGGNLGQGIKGAATGALAGVAGKGVKAIGAPIVGAIGRKIGIGGGDDAGGAPGDIEGGGDIAGADQSIWGKINDGLKHIPGVSGIEDFLGGPLGGIVGGIKDAAGDLLGNGQGGIDGAKAAMLGMGALQVKNIADLQGKSDAMGREALDLVKGNYAERAPLRAAGLSGMLDPKTTDLSHLLDHSGPYAKGIMPAFGTPGGSGGSRLPPRFPALPPTAPPPAPGGPAGGRNVDDMRNYT